MPAASSDYLLACDTTQGACSVALFRGDDCVAQNLEAMPRGQAEALLPMIYQLLQTAELSPQHLTHLAVTIGPGTFTGVRIGLAAMRGLACALEIPLTGISTLAAMAQPCAAIYPIIVIIDARRNEFYTQIFDAQKQDITPPQALTLEALLPHLPAGGLHIIGTGKYKLAEAYGANAHIGTEDNFPHAYYVGHMALTLPVSTQLPEPIYLRPPDATLPAARHIVTRA